VNSRDAAGEGIEKYRSTRKRSPSTVTQRQKRPASCARWSGGRLGAILLFVVVFVTEALTTLRAECSARGRRSRLADEDQFVSVPRNRTKDEAHIDLENWSELGPDWGPDGGVNRSLPGY
jgi:hypothetical protein